MAINQFSEIYRKLPTIKLLEIVENQHDYQELAVETAKLELSTRNDIVDSENEWNKRKNDLLNKSLEAERKKIAKKTSESDDSLEKKGSYKSIQIICVFLFVMLVSKTINNFDFIISSITFLGEGDFSVYLFLLEYFYLPVVIIYAWKTSKIGWIMLLIFFGYGLLTDILNAFWFYKFFAPEQSLLSYMPLAFVSKQLPFLMLHVGLLYYLLRPEVKSLFEEVTEVKENID